VITPDEAYQRGKRAKSAGALRVSPYFEIFEWRDGIKVDFTAELDRQWFAGYDGKPKPEKPRIIVP
jgi:hypothetical protein